MIKKFLWVGLALLFAGAPRAFAMSEVVSVTKETQAKLGLDFALSAVRVSESAVLVRMEAAKKGKLATLKGARLTIGTFGPGSAGSPELSADLKTTSGKDGAMVASFQLSPELAEKCLVELVTVDPSGSLSGELDYAVVLKGYVTDRK